MEFFSEIYNCYFQIMKEIIKQAKNEPITESKMYEISTEKGFEESGFFIIPKLLNGDWPLLKKTEDGKYTTNLGSEPDLPITNLQKAWLKSCLLDKRCSLFLEDEVKEGLKNYLKEVEPLFTEDCFYGFDQYMDGDDYEDPQYQHHVKTIIQGIRNKEFLNVAFISNRNRLMSKKIMPCKLEYSPKNDRLRLLCFGFDEKIKGFETINISSLVSLTRTNETYTKEIQFEKRILHAYATEPVEIMIYDTRNALERAMFHFANYEKSTTRIKDNEYLCQIYYQKDVETELLIDLLSFGPKIKVLGPDSMIKQIRQRLKKQYDLMIQKGQH